MSKASNVVPLRGTNRGSPNTLNGKAPPLRRKNKDLRSREYLTSEEVDQLITAASLILSELNEGAKGAPCTGEDAFIAHLFKRLIEHRTSMQER